MPSLRDLRRRTRSVKNTQQITKAMKMVSAAKLRRAQDAILSARPFAKKMLEVLNSLATRAQCGRSPAAARARAQKRRRHRHQRRQGSLRLVQREHLKKAEGLPEGHRVRARSELQLVGKKSRDYFKTTGVQRSSTRFVDIFRELTYDTAGRDCSSPDRALLDGDPEAENRSTPSTSSTTSSRTPSSKTSSSSSCCPSRSSSSTPSEEELDYIYEPSRGRDLRRGHSAPRRVPGVARAARVRGGGARGAHDRDGEREQERERAHREA